MPKSSRPTSPAGVTRMLDGLRSRCTIRLAWAWLTASHTCANMRSRARSGDVVLAAVVGDRLAVDVLEREVGLAVAADAGIQQARDVGMRQARQDLPLAGEAQPQVGIGQPRAQQLERDPALVQAVGARRRSHTWPMPPSPMRPVQPVRADLLPGLRRRPAAAPTGLDRKSSLPSSSATSASSSAARSASSSRSSARRRSRAGGSSSSRASSSGDSRCQRSASMSAGWSGVLAARPAGTAAPSASRGACCVRSVAAARRSQARTGRRNSAAPPPAPASHRPRPGASARCPGRASPRPGARRLRGPRAGR